MLESIQSMCLHVVFILFTILIYQVFFNERDDERKRITSKFFLLMLIILVFTMSQPVVYSEIYKYDFKSVAIILSFLYGGKRVGFSSLLALLMVGYFTDQNLAILLGNYMVLCLLLLPITKLFHRYGIKGKVTVISLFYSLIPITRGISLLINGDEQELFFELSSSLIVLATLIAVVHLIENMKEQMELRQELLRTEKMNVVSQLAASVAHEIRNPMTSVRGFMQLMQKEDLTKEQQMYISISIEELDRAQEIINQYLALAKPQTDQYETIDLTLTIQQSIDVMHSYAILNSIHIAQHVESSLKIEGLKLEIQQVLINIIKNAIEAIKSKGEIRILAYKDINNFVCIEIKDNGVGMSKEQLKKLGSPYYSTKEKGTGLGLTVCHQIVKQMGGKITIHSELKKGTTFTIKLPSK
ncbi:GHKL domain-containing protein [Fictibacillus sp. 5RED26]|uniref:ATP-binding protein n=2 Tax=Fictibacillus TaxID=1329200 RepID=UPI0018CD851E|nr:MULTISPECIES: ATP-binding protein [unclassified Fictibacillus]MBH0156318.1 GHKL domain-containing protein [Fictibacillus sp. 5RED26]MBH0173473.1 GHKL domain-containing protein [Fictibacillus sp. 23RED33]